MGLLADVYSYGDTLKRKLGGLLSDPGGTIDLGIRRFGEDQQGLLGMAADAGYMPGQRSVLTSPQQQAQARQALADAGAAMAMQAATVWHGSPHKFDAFDSSKIGTGEGAQAYGHGLYLAGNPGTADWYRKQLTPGQYDVKELGIDGVGFKRLDFPEFKNSRQGYGKATLTKKQKDILDKLSDDELDVAADVFYSGDISKLRDRYSGNASNSYGMIPGNEKNLQVLVDLEKRLTQAKKGNLYKVDLPDEHIAKMLDWDKPLSQQAPEVIDAVRKLRPDVLEQAADGSSLYQLLGKRMGSNDAASTALRQAGIPGIRYLDGGSRGAGSGTSNYVVFPGNEGLLQILERNGQALK